MELFSAAYLASKLGCSPLDVIDGRQHYELASIGKITCYLVNSGRGKLDIQITASSSSQSEQIIHA